MCSNDAHILLSEFSEGEGQAYEIVLGTDGNTKNVLRREKSGD